MLFHCLGASLITIHSCHILETRDQRCFKTLWLLLLTKRCSDCPVLFRNKSANFCFAITDYTQCNGLDTSRAGTRLDAAPEEWTNFITNETVQYTASLLSIKKIFI